MKNKRKMFLLCALVIVFCIVMAFIDGVFKANYFVKSAIKLVLFLGAPLVYAGFDKEIELKPLFKLNKSGVKSAALLAVLIYAVILGGYLLLKDIFDFSGITKSLTSNIGVKRENFVFVSLYISFVNSLLEEFFFRGFTFISLQKNANNKFAYIFSAGVFALYHIAMMIGWFSIGIFAIVLAGLFAGGIIFNYLNSKSRTIYPSWFVHMFANFAINTIGFMLFGII